MTQECYKCGKIKSLDDFYKRKVNKNGYCGRCKKCDNILKNDWVKRNPEKVKSYEKKRWRSGKKRKDDLARTRKHRVEMSDSYIRELMTKKCKNLNANDIPKDLVDFYRANLAVKRALKLTPKLKGEEDKP